MSKNLLSISDLSKKEILELIEFAKNFKQDDGSFRKENLFPDKTIANVFCEPSTRTKSSFEIAAKNLGCSVIGFDISNSSVEKGESIYETVDALSLMGRSLVVVIQEMKARGATKIGQHYDIVHRGQVVANVLYNPRF